MNSFGSGGANVYVVMDDAFHYVKERGLTANHPTVPSAKQFPRTYRTRSLATSLAGKTEPNAFVKTVIPFK